MAMIDQIQGKKFGRLLVVGKVNVERRWEAVCKCDCGAKKVASVRMLVRGDTASCGCYRKQRQSETRSAKLEGRVFGELTVEKQGAGIFEGRRKVHNNSWICQCSCGNTTEVTSNALLSGNTRSCGCLAGRTNAARVSQLSKGKISVQTIVNITKDKAIRRGHDWELSDEQALSILLQNCNYCGAEPYKFHEPSNTKYNGIDRIDSSKGYVIGNVVACCKNCNYTKNNMTIEEFKAHVKAMYDHMLTKRPT